MTGNVAKGKTAIELAEMTVFLFFDDEALDYFITETRRSG